MKIEKYASLAKAEGARFAPCVLETFGAWGDSARALLKELGRDAALTQNSQPGGFIKYGRQLMSIVPQHGNAHVMRVGCGGRRGGRRMQLCVGLEGAV